MEGMTSLIHCVNHSSITIHSSKNSTLPPSIHSCTQSLPIHLHTDPRIIHPSTNPSIHQTIHPIYPSTTPYSIPHHSFPLRILLTSDLLSSSIPSFCVPNLLLTTASALMAFVRIVRYLVASALIGSVSFPDSVLVHRSLN